MPRRSDSTDARCSAGSASTTARYNQSSFFRHFSDIEPLAAPCPWLCLGVCGVLLLSSLLLAVQIDACVYDYGRNSCVGGCMINHICVQNQPRQCNCLFSPHPATARLFAAGDKSFGTGEAEAKSASSGGQAVAAPL